MSRFEYDGYSFATAKEMDIAKKEEESIQYIKSKLDKKEREKVRKLYDSLCEKQSFVTPVGIAFMKELYEEVSMFSATPVPMVPVTIPLSREKAASGKYAKDVLAVAEKRKKAKKEECEVKLRNQRIVIGFLVFIIIGMFFIVFTSKNSPLADAQKRAEDKYAKWQEELQEKEAELQLREEKLNKE